MRAWVIALALFGCGAAKEELENSKRELAKLQVKKLAQEAYARWSIKTNETCPKSLGDVATAIALDAKDLQDPWGSPLAFECNTGGGIRVVSHGPDGKAGTGDDISSQ